MQTLYVVDFTVLTGAGKNDPYASVLECMTDWLRLMSSGDLAVQSLEKDGGAELAKGTSGGRRAATWETAAYGPDRAVRLNVREEFPDSTPAFTTTVVLTQADQETRLRITMGRESSPTWLTPTSAAQLYQPRLVRNLMLCRDLTLTIEGQTQDGRYLQVRTPDEVHLLGDVIRNPHRLPILIVHARTLAALEATKRASNGLVGLARVVTLDLPSIRALGREMPGYAPGYAGALLVWSDLKARPVAFPAEVVNSGDSDSLREPLMKILAPLTVLARGQQTAFSQIRRRQLGQTEESAQRQSEKARQAGDVDGQIEALRRQLEAAVKRAREWEQYAEEEANRADAAEAQAEEVAQLRAQVDQLTVALSEMSKHGSEGSREDEVAIDEWSTVPSLLTGDGRSAEDLFLALQDITGGRIVFTDRAARSWKKCRYPNPDEMTEAVIGLARAADKLYDGEDRTMGHLDKWLRDEFDLRVSLADDTIEKNKKLRYFDWEGEVYDRTPHVKVADATKPNQVGRIHFALDPQNGRFVVDHVALKLY